MTTASSTGFDAIPLHRCTVVAPAWLNPRGVHGRMVTVRRKTILYGEGASGEGASGADQRIQRYTDRALGYFDWASTAPLLASARRAMDPWLGETFGNPSSVHRMGRASRMAVEECRAAVATVLKVAPEEIVFVSGATEADNLAVLGSARARREEYGRQHIVVGALEHSAILRPAEALTREGFEVTVVASDSSGVISAAAVRAALRFDTSIVALMAVNNEIGTVQPVQEVAQAAHQVGALLICDAVQAGAGLLPDVVCDGEADLVTLSSHKLGGPPGAGLLYCRRGIRLHPLMFGGAQENSMRPGTENVPAIVGMAAALREVVEDREARGIRLHCLEQRVLDLETIVPCCSLVGDRKCRLPGIAAFEFEGVEAETLLFALDMESIAASGGAACASRTVEVSPVLLSMGMSAARARTVVRFSWGPSTSEEEVMYLLGTVPRIVKRLREGLDQSGPAGGAS